MRTVALAVAVALSGVAPAQTPPDGKPVSNTVPATAGDPVSLPGGTDISRPLTPVGPEPPPPPKVPAEGEPKSGAVEKAEKAEKVEKKHGPLGSWWDTDDLLLWWPKSHGLPNLVTASRTGALPVIGQGDTRVLVGGGAIDNQVISGGRFVRGWSLDHEDTVGIEFAYFFLGTRSANFAVNNTTFPYPALGLPYVNAATGREDVLSLAAPGRSSAYLTVGSSVRVQGFEANAVANLFASESAKLHFVAGYRYFQVNEGLRLEHTYLELPSLNRNLMLGRAADQFDTANRFSGGQVGLHADLRKGPLFVELIGKVAFGGNYEVVRVGGETHTATAGPGVAVNRSFQSGVYAQPGNTGRVTNMAFAVVPEGTFKVGLRLSDTGRIFAAYNFMYLSDAVRPGDQVDRTLNPAQVPLLTGVAATGLSDRPRLALNRSDFWVQGVVIGLEARY